MSARLPYGAAEILAARSAGNRPADMVLVSLIGPLREVNPVVIAKPDRAVDWRFLADLDVMLVADSASGGQLLRRIADSVCAVKPRWFGLWLADAQDGTELCKGRKPFRFLVADRLEFAGLGNPSGREECLKIIGRSVKARAMDSFGRFDTSVTEAGMRGLKAIFAQARAA